MGKTKHAPAPWHVAEWEVRDNDGAIEAEGWQVVGADGYAINTCISAGDGEQEEANLHFIVRAVNSHDQLLQALRAGRVAIDVLMAQLIELDPSFLPTKSAAWPALVAIKNALAAAEA